ncbi:MAG: CRISPR-associated protein Csx11 [Candidatus Hydrothermae bacterium]|nr:CRISPR-associated protein Csx11 [Candidatus Hydrothermae bacterium]
MNDLIQTIIDKKKDILIGEIGALLHDIGKCHSNFIGKNSIENIPTVFDHANIDEFLENKFVDFVKSNKLEFIINNENTSVYSLIKEHHNEKNDNIIINILESCDHLDSADDKGIVRRKQSKDNTIISSPFGYLKEKIDLQCLKKRLNDLECNLIDLFQKYTTENMDIICFRKSLINNLKTTFSHALGETRIPANDVTLWDHSHSTASLFKSVLCAMALGENPDHEKLQWRILGFCWDGIGFINKGKKIADIQVRNKIIEDIKNKLTEKFEVEIPIGNVIYEDNNGIYFTFPALNKNSEVLAAECAKIGLEIIREKSDNEIWPFFTLSKPSRRLTILAEELKFASQKRNIPKMSPTLFIKQEDSDDKIKEEKIPDSHDMPTPKDEEDICPVCKFRAKSKENERCDVCENRRKGRLNEWLNNRENTIWIDEIADTNNRVALLTLNFDLDKWLDGTMVGTIYSQSFEDWKNSNRATIFFEDEQKKQKLKNRGIKIDDSLINLSKNLLKIITDDDIKKDPSFKSDLINTFYEDIKSEQTIEDKNYVENFINNIKERIMPAQFNSCNLQKLIFIQNPSPARLYRIWKETKEFFDLVINKVNSEIYQNKWKRINFSVDYNELKSKLKQNATIEDNTPYIIKIKDLTPENVLVFHSTNGEFYTIESLEKYRYGGKSGIEAVKEAFSNEINWISTEDDPDTNLLQNNQNVKINNQTSEEYYYPFIEITTSPLSLRLLVPASDAIKILESIVKLYNQRFEKVIGKLPLNMGLLVANRKFPLYVLLEAGGRMFRNKEFKDPELMDIWWDINGLMNDEYYSYYPVVNKKDFYNLDELSRLSKGGKFALYPGYFDFDLLLGTNDRYNIFYKNKKRAGKDYKLYSKRPYYFYQFAEMINLWETLTNNISSSQINFIEEMFTNKLREWRNVSDANQEEVFKKFAEATIKDAFSENWNKLKIETQDFILKSAYNGLLLDTIILFNHTIKGGQTK